MKQIFVDAWADWCDLPIHRNTWQSKVFGIGLAIVIASAFLVLA